jgi:hypothetical protein
MAQWWSDPLVSEAQRNQLRALVANGQMEWVGGGWVQNDEAITRFEDQLDQHTLGRLWLQSTLGAPPVTAAWQADPFGASIAPFLRTHQTTSRHFYTRPRWPSFLQVTVLRKLSCMRSWHRMLSFWGAQCHG